MFWSLAFILPWCYRVGMNERYGVQGDGFGEPGLANDPRVPRQPGSVQLWYVVDHVHPNVWGQSPAVSGALTEVKARELAESLNAEEDLKALYEQRPFEPCTSDTL